MMDLSTEQELVERAKDSLEAFDKLYEYYLPKIYSYIFNRTGNKEVTEDITSQTFTTALLKIKTYRYKGCSFGAWLYRIAHNKTVDYFRSVQKVDNLDFEKIVSSESSESDAEKRERQLFILNALKDLAPQYQELITLKYFQELENEEIAEILGCRRETVAVKLHRSMRALKKILEKPNNLSSLNIN